MTLFTPTDLLCVQLYVYIQHYVEIHILINLSDYLHSLACTHSRTLSLSFFMRYTDPEATFVTIDNVSNIFPRMSEGRVNGNL